MTELETAQLYIISELLGSDPNDNPTQVSIPKHLEKLWLWQYCNETNLIRSRFNQSTRMYDVQLLPTGKEVVTKWQQGQ